jgi:hypothetical protein
MRICQHVAGNPLTEMDEEAKLALVIRAASSLWASASQGLKDQGRNAVLPSCAFDHRL